MLVQLPAGCLTLRPENTQECSALAQLPIIISSALTCYTAEAYSCLAQCQARETFSKLCTCCVCKLYLLAAAAGVGVNMKHASRVAWLQQTCCSLELCRCTRLLSANRHVGKQGTSGA